MQILSIGEYVVSTTEKPSPSKVSNAPIPKAAQCETHAPNNVINGSEKSKLSIALKRDTSGKTKITAKGSGELAEQILQIAFEKGIKVRTDADLTELLSAVDVESDIPIEGTCGCSYYFKLRLQ